LGGRDLEILNPREPERPITAPVKFKVFNLFVSKKTHDAKVAELEAAHDNSVAYHLKNHAALNERFKKAVTDLEAKVRENEGLRAELEVAETALAPWKEAAIRDETDALKHRARLERDRNRVRPSRAKSPAKAGKK
jgi:hypothetical protein